MDINDLRTLFTVLGFVLFAAIVAWTYATKRKSAFDEAARQILDEDAGTRSGPGQQEN